MIAFVYHDGIRREIVALERRFRDLPRGFSALERLCDVQFHPTQPHQIIAPAKLHRVTQNNDWTMWKVELVVPNSGLRPNQFPRVWFVVRGGTIAFLCMASHTDNYDDADVTRLAMSRVTDVF